MLSTPRKSLSRLYNGRMIPRRNISRSAAQRARDTAGIIGSLKHEGYVPTPEAEAVHKQVARGEITTEEAIAIFRERALVRDRSEEV
jgi:Antitoxin VbhA